MNFNVKHQAARHRQRGFGFQAVEFLAQPFEFRLAHPERQRLQFGKALGLGVLEQRAGKIRAEFQNFGGQWGKRPAGNIAQSGENFLEFDFLRSWHQLLDYHPLTWLA